MMPSLPVWNDVESDTHQVRLLLIDEHGQSAEELKKHFARYADKGAVWCAQQNNALQTALRVQPTVILQGLATPADAGLELISSIRAAATCRDVPIVVLSSSGEAVVKNAAFLAGANDFIVEPSDELEVISRLHYHSNSYCTRRDLRSTANKLEKAHDQLLQSEKMASMGMLAAGVAHEINNPIAFVTSNLNSLDGYCRDLFRMLDAYSTVEKRVTDTGITAINALKHDLKLGDVREDISQILDECRDGMSRVRKIVDNLKSFSRMDESEWLCADMHEELDRALNLAGNELKYKAEIVKEYADLPQVYCIPTQLNQVFLNLLVNAAHAIENRGRITLTTCLSRAPDVAGCREQDESEWVRIAVADTGSGMDDETKARIFEPFFTTKETGKGTGLGLSVSHGIVQTHNGHISVASSSGEGTTFTVWLPVNRCADVTETVQHPER